MNFSILMLPILDVTRVEENGEYPFERPPAERKETQDGHTIDGDSIYCAGHTHLQDGRILYAGGARYAYVKPGMVGH